MAAVRTISGTQYLWTCHHVGVNSSGNNDGSPADRTAVEWFKIQMQSTPPSASIVSNNRIYDSAATSPKFYYYPSLAVNQNGDVALGFSGSGVNDYIGAYYFGTLNGGSSPTAPIRFYAGKDWYSGNGSDIRWGDYSNTSLDSDGLKFWTLQEYAETRYATGINAWGTRFVAITPF